MTLRAPERNIAFMNRMQLNTQGRSGNTTIVLEVRSDRGTVRGNVIAPGGEQSFWGWLELMSALEHATGGPSQDVPGAPAFA